MLNRKYENKTVLICRHGNQYIEYVRANRIRQCNHVVVMGIGALKGFYVHNYIEVGLSESISNELYKENLTLEQYINKYCKHDDVIEEEDTRDFIYSLVNNKSEHASLLMQKYVTQDYITVLRKLNTKYKIDIAIVEKANKEYFRMVIIGTRSNLLKIDKKIKENINLNKQNNYGNKGQHKNLKGRV